MYSLAWAGRAEAFSPNKRKSPSALTRLCQRLQWAGQGQCAIPPHMLPAVLRGFVPGLISFHLDLNLLSHLWLLLFQIPSFEPMMMAKAFTILGPVAPTAAD